MKTPKQSLDCLSLDAGIVKERRYGDDIALGSAVGTRLAGKVAQLSAANSRQQFLVEHVTNLSRRQSCTLGDFLDFHISCVLSGLIEDLVFRIVR